MQHHLIFIYSSNHPSKMASQMTPKFSALTISDQEQTEAQSDQGLEININNSKEKEGKADERQQHHEERATGEAEKGVSTQSMNNQTIAPRLPFILFVYGPLADPFFLTYTMNMGSNPTLTPSSISGYRIKFINHRYPAPIPAHGNTISESSIPIENEEQLRKITKWYGGAYKLVDCKITVMRNEGGEDYAHSAKDWVPPRWVRDRVVEGRVFAWAGGEQRSGELSEGCWDEEWWEMERDAIMRLKRETNPRELESWEVRQRDRFDVWREEEREAERLRLLRDEERKMRKGLDSRRGNERMEDDLKA
jgi:hypothetical protein